MRPHREREAAEQAERARVEKLEREWIDRHEKEHAADATETESHIEFQSLEVARGTRAYYAELAGLKTEPNFAAPDRVSFVFERVCRGTIAFWRKFADYQDNSTARGHELGQGVCAFRKTLALYEKGCGEKYDVWVAYVTNAKPTTIADRAMLVPSQVSDEGPQDETGIEMVVTVLVHRETPVTSHVGIFRTHPFWEYYPPKTKSVYGNVPFGHKGLSPLIHAFAAGAALYMYPHLRKNGVMVTRPVPVMSAILRKAMRAGEITVGSPSERVDKYVATRARRHASAPHDKKGGYSEDVYTPPLNQAYMPFFAEGRKEFPRTWIFGEVESNEPEWMSRGNCEHDDVSPRASDDTAMEHTVMLSALARKWPGKIMGCRVEFGRAPRRWV